MLYCANPPTRLRGVIDRLNPRSRAFLKLERACFGPQSATHLLLLSATQRADYHRRWALDPARVTMVPPTIERNRVVAPEDRASVRARLRTDFSVAGETPVWLFVGSFPDTKGLDRVIAALPSFPEAHLLCVGANENALVPFRNQASQLGVAARVSWLGPREDVPALMTASDMLVHPSRLDITGTVILEAIVNGLPVIATEICGYATHIAHSRAGQVLAEPFAQSELIAALQTADAPTRVTWRGAAQRYAATVDLFSGLDIAAQAIVTTGQNSARSATHSRKMRR